MSAVYALVACSVCKQNAAGMCIQLTKVLCEEVCLPNRSQTEEQAEHNRRFGSQCDRQVFTDDRVASASGPQSSTHYDGRCWAALHISHV